MTSTRSYVTQLWRGETRQQRVRSAGSSACITGTVAATAELLDATMIFVETMATSMLMMSGIATSRVTTPLAAADPDRPLLLALGAAASAPPVVVHASCSAHRYVPRRHRALRAVCGHRCTRAVYQQRAPMRPPPPRQITWLYRCRL